MNPEELDAGPEMDKLVAERIFGRGVRSKITESLRCYVYSGDDPDIVPPYSTDDAAALEVFKKFQGGFDNGVAKGMRREVWYGCTLFDKSGEMLYAEAPTLALAICRAALKAVEVKE